MTVLLEACVDSLELAIAAEKGGAERIELCDRLDIGGTTPSQELIEQVVKAVRIPVNPIIRVRGGDFFYTDAEIDQMKRDTEMAARAGAAGIVLGVLNADRTVDAKRTRDVMKVAPHIPATFHLAFDATRDLNEALDAVAAIGIARVLSKGGAETALEGVDTLRTLVSARLLSASWLAEVSVPKTPKRSCGGRVFEKYIHAGPKWRPSSWQHDAVNEKQIPR